MNGTNSAMNQIHPHSKRISNRTPQSFTVNDKVGGMNKTSNKHNDVVKRSSTSNVNYNHVYNSNNASNQAAAFSKNITDLHKNAMHIKKLNFAGGRQMQSHATQPVIASHESSSHYTAVGATHFN